MLIPMKDLLDDAKKRRYGIAAPNVFNLESVEAAFQAARELNAPIILDCAPAHGIEEVSAIAHFFASKYRDVSAALNLDHGDTFEAAIRAIRSGFTSVMVDRSTLPYKDNVDQVTEITKIAHAVGVSVEAELGHVGVGLNYNETRDKGLTNPDQAADFVKKTNIDCLAVAVGTSHGNYKGEPYLEFDLIETIERNVNIPLVLHGGSGTGDINLQRAIALGIQKINLFTDLNKEGMEQLKSYVAKEVPDNIDGDNDDEFSEGVMKLNIREASQESMKGYKTALKYYMKLFGSANKV
ncbi:class II fructose-bisphosphate aldolase [Oceanobacillus alkalisoli]|uniref:class II fructose-bisphosphate aldolase n=1 Tax=Oceanobacillus alkalisoli TaxID=2925113 RepID=UPI001EF0D58A|nr:class II fructose-bisphosphate aldolase [Oceanobacillus alkalisoli]MCF3944095.1 class II fructose-bisphosphate aldolase [Oceanobacillus alkalisoli]MCG5102502.1 class II fructose-bisphosphate aldolase [Oceanobacillus alkalisoli]